MSRRVGCYGYRSHEENSRCIANCCSPRLWSSLQLRWPLRQRKFLSEAAQGDNSEIQLGQLISERGSSAAVRDFGKTLVSDHTQALAQVTAAAHEMNVQVPNSIMAAARAERAKLEHLRGAAFDREVKRYMIHDHRNDISKFEMQARSGDRRKSGSATASDTEKTPAHR